MNHKAKIQVIKYYQAENQTHWCEEIGKGDWAAAKLLHDWLKSDIRGLDYDACQQCGGKWKDGICFKY